MRFESVNYRATVWLNGHQLGSHAGGVPAVRVRPERSAPGGQPPDRPGRQPPTRGRPAARPGRPAGGTTAGSCARCTCAPCRRADLAQVQIQTAAPVFDLRRDDPGAGARAQRDSGSPDGSAQRPLRDARGSTSARPRSAAHGPGRPSATARSRIRRLWSPGHPNLYRATLTLSDSLGRRLGGYVTDSGIRTIAVTPDGRLDAQRAAAEPPRRQPPRAGRRARRGASTRPRSRGWSAGSARSARP